VTTNLKDLVRQSDAKMSSVTIVNVEVCQTRLILIREVVRALAGVASFLGHQIFPSSSLILPIDFDPRFYRDFHMVTKWLLKRH
jgi:hypothetical protein